MTSQEQYLYGLLANAEGQLNNQSLRLDAAATIKQGKDLIRARELQRNAGLSVSDLDGAVVASIHGSVVSKFTAINDLKLTFPTLNEVNAGLAEAAQK